MAHSVIVMATILCDEHHLLHHASPGIIYVFHAHEQIRHTREFISPSIRSLMYQNSFTDPPPAPCLRDSYNSSTLAVVG